MRAIERGSHRCQRARGHSTGRPAAACAAKPPPWSSSSLKAARRSTLTPMRERVGIYDQAGFPNYPAPGSDGYPARVDVSRRLAMFAAAMYSRLA